MCGSDAGRGVWVRVRELPGDDAGGVQGGEVRPDAEKDRRVQRPGGGRGQDGRQRGGVPDRRHRSAEGQHHQRAVQAMREGVDLRQAEDVAGRQAPAHHGPVAPDAGQPREFRPLQGLRPWRRLAHPGGDPAVWRPQRRPRPLLRPLPGQPLHLPDQPVRRVRQARARPGEDRAGPRLHDQQAHQGGPDLGVAELRRGPPRDELPAQAVGRRLWRHRGAVGPRLPGEGNS
mmetsp:Transcript_13506/g.38249  ORF Transcript_13506/g.38249 Transcript_13506/m.38249 type:complete len:230 (-) Transcript_13506:216-905(-)